MKNNSIHIKGIRKSFKDLEVLKGVDFDVKKRSIFALLGIFTLALTWLAVIAGLAAKSPDGAGAFSYPIVFLPFISSAFVPTNTMPSGVRIFAENQPVTSIVDAIHNLLSNQPVGNDLWGALVWCIGIIIIAYFFAMKLYKRTV